MAGGTLEATFGVRTLSTAIRTFADNSTDRFCRSVFEKGRKVIPEGRTVEWDEVQFHRHLAPVVGHNSPAPKVEETTRIPRTAPLIHIKLFKDISGDRMFHDRAPGSLRANAAQLVAQELADLQNAIDKTIEFLCASALQGTLTVNNSTVPGSDVAFTISYGVQTASKAAAWTTAGTGIVSDEIPKLQAAYTQGSGLLPAQALINDVTERSLLGNTEVQNWAKQMFGAMALMNNSLSPQVFSGLKLGGMDWKKTPGGYVPQGGSFTRYVSDAKVIVLPEDGALPNVLGLAEGHGIIPRNAFGAGAEGLVELAPSPGFYSYATANESPAGVRIYAGWVGMPLLFFPSGVMFFSSV